MVIEDVASSIDCDNGHGALLTITIPLNFLLDILKEALQ